MQKEVQPTKKMFAAIGAFVGWAAVGLQLYLLLNNRTASIPETIIRFFSFFTILTNILVALCFTNFISKPSWNLFTRPSTLTAVTVYILVVGIVYNLVLRNTWNPQGLQKVVDEFLHSVIPTYFLIYWAFCVNKRELKWTSVFSWLLYPLVYFIYILLRGTVSGFYPYPFVDVTNFGYGRVAINAVVLLFFFLGLSLLFVAIGKWMDRQH